jgi:hypothetical protein
MTKYGASRDQYRWETIPEANGNYARFFKKKQKDLVYYSPIIATFFGLNPSMAPSTLGSSSRGDRFYRTTLSFSRNWFCDHETIQPEATSASMSFQYATINFLVCCCSVLIILGDLDIYQAGRQTVMELDWMWQDTGEYFNVQHSWCIIVIINSSYYSIGRSLTVYCRLLPSADLLHTLQCQYPTTHTLPVSRASCPPKRSDLRVDGANWGHQRYFCAVEQQVTCELAMVV